jgi:hypothetical protein
MITVRILNAASMITHLHTSQPMYQPSRMLQIFHGGTRLVLNECALFLDITVNKCYKRKNETHPDCDLRTWAPPGYF